MTWFIVLLTIILLLVVACTVLIVREVRRAREAILDRLSAEAQRVDDHLRLVAQDVLGLRESGDNRISQAVQDLQDAATDQAQLVLEADGVLQQLAARLDNLQTAQTELKKAVEDLTEYLEDDRQRRENERQEPKGFYS